MLDLPDVLDHLGKTPREFGSIHVHFEALDPVDAQVTRRCLSCGFSGSAIEYERARSCPSCDAPWV